MKKKSCSFVPFKLDVNVCAECGQIKNDHDIVPTMYSPFREAVWKVLITHGGFKNYYGGIDETKTWELRNHFGYPAIREDDERWVYNVSWTNRIVKSYPPADPPCAIDWTKTYEPYMSTVEEFAGTFNESSTIDVVMGDLFCKCGEYSKDEYNSEIVLENLTIGQMIWLAVQAGEIKV